MDDKEFEEFQDSLIRAAERLAVVLYVLSGIFAVVGLWGVYHLLRQLFRW